MLETNISEASAKAANDETVRRIKMYMLKGGNKTIALPDGSKLRVLQKMGFTASKGDGFYQAMIAVRIPEEALMLAKDANELKAVIVNQITEAFK